MKKNTSIIFLKSPIILTIGIFTIPFVSDYAKILVTEEAAKQTERWFCSHIISGIASGI